MWYGHFCTLTKYANISIAKNNIIVAKATRFTSIIGCNHYRMTCGNFSFTFSIEHTIVVTYSCIYKQKLAPPSLQSHMQLQRLVTEVTHRITMFVVAKLVGLDISRIEVANVGLEWTRILLVLVVYLFSKLAQIKSYKVMRIIVIQRWFRKGDTRRCIGDKGNFHMNQNKCSNIWS